MFGIDRCPVGFQQTHEARIAKKVEASQKMIRKEFQKEDAFRRKEAFVKIREQAKASRENLQVVNIEVDNQIGLDRDLLDEVFLPKENVVTRWIKSIPIKINVFTWKLHLDRIPTRINLDRREVQVPSILCPVCNVAHEDTSRLFFSCVVATNIARLIYRWWNLTWIPVVLKSNMSFCDFITRTARECYVDFVVEIHYNICHYPQGQIRGFPGDLSLGIAFPGDMSPGISGTEKLEWDSFPGDIVGPT
ncbi:RNA-directed DNA polymerase, eukaryota [Tanacetum coccineum]